MKETKRRQDGGDPADPASSRSAIKGMLPKSNIGKEMYRKLKVYAGPDTSRPPSSPRS
ncbi:MAG: uL13 family ribosomal protein [Paludibaculum sp.]